MKPMREAMRWYGVSDPVTLDHIKQAGAAEVVSALHDIYDGSVWPESAILAHKARIESQGLFWNVVESIPVHNDIKIAGPKRDQYIDW